VLRVEARTHVGALALELRLEVAAGECLALAGPSGAGKTSVLRIAAGLLRPRYGVVVANGRRWLDTERGVDVAPERRRCGYVFQEYALFPHLNAWQNIAYPLRGPGRRERALELLDRFGLAARADARPRARSAHQLASVLDEIQAPALLVTHDFAEAAQLGDRVGIIDGGRIVQEGTATELAAAPRSAFVADFTGAAVLTGTATSGPDGLTRIALDGGGAIASTDPGAGPVAVSVYPWEIAIEPAGEARHGSAQNRLVAEVTSVTTIGNRVRLGLAAPQPFVAEITGAAARELGLRRGARVTASWKAAATRVVAR
jgi:molybdate transport system ATP-binding protein